MEIIYHNNDVWEKSHSFGHDCRRNAPNKLINRWLAGRQAVEHNGSKSEVQLASTK